MEIWFEPDWRDQEERYLYEERLGMMGVLGRPTLTQWACARAAVDAAPVGPWTPLCAWPHRWEIESAPGDYRWLERYAADRSQRMKACLTVHNGT